MRFFFDMDGTLARFYEDPNCLEKYRTPGFFRNLNPYRNMVNALRMLRERNDIHAYVLSACENPAVEAEKEEWLADQLRDQPPIGCFFCKPTESKAEYMKTLFQEDLKKDDVLFDDYSLRLKEWESAGGTAVKVLNEFNGCGINGHNFSGSGKTISAEADACEIYLAICKMFDLPLKPKEPPSLTIMVGLPGSGKSTVANALCGIEPSLKLISSDEIRKELYGDEGIQGSAEDVFKIVNERIHKAIAENQSVVYDATNLYPKSRKSVLNAIPKGKDVLVKFWVINTPLQECLRRNAERERVVPEDVIIRMAKHFTYPTKNEWPHSIVITKN